MAESTMTRAAPGDGEAAGALLATKELVKPEKSTGSIKGILAGAAAASFALGQSGAGALQDFVRFRGGDGD